MIKVHQILMLGVLVVCLAAWGGAAALASTLRVFSDGVPLSDEYAPILTDGGFAVPLALASRFGANVVEDESGYLVRFSGRLIRVTPEKAVVEGDEGSSVAQPLLIGRDIFLPLRFMANFLGLKVSWDVSENRLDIAPWRPLKLGGGSDDGANANPSSRSSVSIDLRSSTPESTPVKQPGPEGGESPEPGAKIEVSSARATILLPSGDPQAGDAGKDDPEEGSGRRISASLLLDLITQPEGTRGNQEPSGLGQRATGSAQSPAEREDEPLWPALTFATGLTVSREISDGLVSYRFEADNPFEIETAFLVDPYRLVVDFTGIAAKPVEPLEVGSPLVRTVRSAVRGDELRLIFDLEQGVGHRLEHEGKHASLVLLRPMGGFTVDAGAHGGRILLDVSGNTPYEVARLHQPERVVIDLRDTTLTRGAAAVETDRGPVSAVRAAQFQPDVARVVLDLEGSGETELRIAPAGGNLAIDYGDRVTPVAYRSIDEREMHLGVRAPEDAQVTTHRLARPDRLVVDIRPMQLTIPVEDAHFLEGPVSAIRVSQFDKETVRLVADLRYYVRHGVKKTGGRTVIVLEQPVLAGRTITLDAGHGGRDPGAIGVRLGLVEKDVNLDITRRLADLVLEADGEPVLTRRDDSYPSLWERPSLANEVESDAFVSIHNNSAMSESETAKGTETYIRRDDAESAALGQAIQSSLVSAIGTVDRGVRTKSLAVLRYSDVPTVLVEVAFLTHPDDEELLAEPWFRRRAAEGIFNGLLKFFNPEEALRDEELDLASIEEAPPWQPLERGSVGGTEIAGAN